MRIRLIVLALVGFAPLAPQATAQDNRRVVIRDTVRRVTSGYQGHNRGPEQTEPFSRKIKLGRDGRVSISNIAGEIVVTGGWGDGVSIEAVKRTRGDRSELSRMQIRVDERGGRVDVRTEQSGRTTRAWVDYTVTVPTSTSVDLHSYSGDVRVSNVHGAVRLETISGNVMTSGVPHVEAAKSVSGNVDLADTSVDGDLVATTLSGHVRARGVTARGLQLGSVSGNVTVSDVHCDRVDVKSVSGNVEFAGTLTKSGRYDMHSHSGTIRLTLSGNTGFELNASSFSGSVRSDLPLVLGPTSARNDRRRPGPSHATRAVFGDGSAVLTLRTFSGDIVITNGK